LARPSIDVFSQTEAPEPGDEAVGEWSPEQLERMNALFVACLERAIAIGSERQRRASNASRPDAPYAITRYLLPATAVDGKFFGAGRDSAGGACVPLPPRFRTIQVYPKDLPVLPRQLQRAVSYVLRGSAGPGGAACST
jgi:hypothetical protein